MKIHVFKIDIGKLRFTNYLRKFHAIVNGLEAEYFAFEAQDDKQALDAARQYVRDLVGHWRNAAAIEDATWCLIPLGTVDNAHCVIACAGHGYYYRAPVAVNVDFTMSDPIKCVPVTGDLTEYED